MYNEKLPTICAHKKQNKFNKVRLTGRNLQNVLHGFADLFADPFVGCTARRLSFFFSLSKMSQSAVDKAVRQFQQALSVVHEGKESCCRDAPHLLAQLLAEALHHRMGEGCGQRMAFDDLQGVLGELRQHVVLHGPGQALVALHQPRSAGGAQQLALFLALLPSLQYKTKPTRC